MSAVDGLNPRYWLLLPSNGGVALRHDDLYVAVVEGLQHAASNVHVLPRHATSSIRRQEGRVEECLKRGPGSGRRGLAARAASHLRRLGGQDGVEQAGKALVEVVLAEREHARAALRARTHDARLA